MKYVLIIAGYALILWGIYTIRRESAGGRAVSYREGRAEIEAVIEEFVAAAERVRSDLERKSAELQRLINLADDRLAKLIQAQSAAPQAPAHSPELPAVPAANLQARGRAAAAASYKAQAAGAGGSGGNGSHGAQESMSVRATLTGQDKDQDQSAAGQARERGEAGERKVRRDRSRHAEVYGLADSGQSVVEIARLTGLSKGEVQLILDLRKTR
ncbi:MAG: DUF6115 domain-containing protein [Chloroflexota bacterium]